MIAHRAAFKRDMISYQPDWDAFLCPQGRLLYRSASRLFWQYQAEKMGCTCCLVRDRCLSEHDRCSARKLEYGYFMPQRRKNLER